MLRIGVWLLVAANLVLLGWAITRGDRSAPEAERRAVSEDRVPPGVDRLLLLSEAPRGSAGRSQMRSAAAACARIAPFLRIDSASDVAARARFDGLSVDVVAADLPAGPPDFQVHLPPRPSLDDARRALTELAALDLEAYVVEEGDLRNAVSVGVYTEAAGASARRDELEALGYAVTITEIPRERRGWELRLSAPGAAALEAFMERVGADFPELSVEAVPCVDPAADTRGAPTRAEIAGTAGIA